MKINVIISRSILCIYIACFLFVLPQVCFAQNVNQPGGPAEPVRVLSEGIDMGVHDGRLRPVVGVENIQVLRANRTRPETADNFGWTYNHAPMLAYWNGKFFLEYLSNPFGEHVAPGQTLVANSSDGRNWDMPKQVFPIYLVRPSPISGNESGMAMMHQRMGFYVAPNGRLLVLAFYGHAPSLFGAGGIGRVVREAYKDGSYGPIYFIRYSVLGKQNESNTSTYPFFTHSSDKGFVEACNALLADKLMTLQWYEENPSENGFFTVAGHKAASVYHRKDGTSVVLWKESWAAISSDEGKTWSTPVRLPTLITDGAKAWGQRTKDGRFAILYNPANDGSHRWPLAVVSSEDGVVFENMVLIDGEIAPRRYFGRAKDFGLQYVRGISEGNGDPPGSDLWVTYSSNKEDIWISRVPVPIRFKVEGPVEDTFDKIDVGARVPDWNLYSPKWAPVGIVAFPGAYNKSLQLEDSDPYNYAKAVRVFAESNLISVSFKVFAHQLNNGRLEIEILDHGGHRPVRLIFGDDGHLQVADGSKMVNVGAYKANRWYTIEVAVNATEGKYDLSLDSKLLVRQAAFAESVSTVERLSFRTGTFRTEPTRETDRYAGGDLPNPGDPSQAAVYNIDEVIIK
ncbi:MAG TPA: hypothetical protein VMV77_21205 [Bacteroidales bacterium]|nr:hypothetical protein [Bacteroidales bacterium]